MRRPASLLLVAVAGLALLAGSARAATPPFFARFPEDPQRGAGADQMQPASAIASDPKTGDLLVAEPGNKRIAEFSPWGQFLKAFGWDVAPGAVNEQQEVRLRATAGTFDLSFEGQSTPDLPFDASGVEVEAALDALSTVSAGDGSVGVEASLASQAPGRAPSIYLVSFDQGPLAGRDVAALLASQGSPPLSGGIPTSTVEVQTRANGNPGTIGLEACTAESGCRKGSEGGGAGQFQGLTGLAVSPGGEVYASETQSMGSPGSSRVQVFNRAGEFLRSWGGGVVTGGAAGTGDLQAGSATITNLTTGFRQFEVGQTLNGVGIAPGTIVVDLGIGTVALSKPATASGTGVAITAAEGAGNVPTNERQSIAIGGAPTGGSFTLTLHGHRFEGTLTMGSDQLTQTHVRTVELQSLGSIQVGDDLRILAAEGLPPGTKVAAIDKETGAATLTAEATKNVSTTIEAAETTAPIPFNASPSAVEEALQSLAGVGAGEVTVTGQSGGPWQVEFDGPLLSDTDIVQMSASAAALTPFGSVSVATEQQGASAPEVCEVAVDCRAGVSCQAPGAFEPGVGFPLATGSDGTVYVGDGDRIEEFDPNGAFEGQVTLSTLHGENVGFPAGGQIQELAFDPKSGGLYFSLPQADAEPAIFSLDAATGRARGLLRAPAPKGGTFEALAFDADGDLYASFAPSSNGLPKVLERRILEWGPAGEVKISFDQAFDSPPETASGDSILFLPALAVNAADDLYVAEHSFSLAQIASFGPPPVELAPPPVAPPTITEQFAASVGSGEASLRAKINPRFWNDTRYLVEYGTAPCFEGGCRLAPRAGGKLLTGEVVSSPQLASVLLAGLAPATTYHYRFVAQGSGGGPVKGLSGKSGAEAEATFTTSAPPPPQPPCPANAALRPGPAAALPDCRAYEMVSPVDKNGADLEPASGPLGAPAGLDQAATSGEAVTYSSYRAFGEVESSPYASQYLATRTGSGWSTRSISPPRGEAVPNQGLLDSQYQGFSADLCQGWLIQDTENPLAEGWVEGWRNVYRRDVCAGTYEHLAPDSVPKTDRTNYSPEIQGFSADGSTSLVISPGKLTNNASEESQLYQARAGKLKLVCVKPDGSAAKGPCTAGTGATGGDANRRFRRTWLPHAISDDGSVIYWTEAESGPGPLYARVNGSETVALGSGQFWTASPDGQRAIFSGAGLREFHLATKLSTLIAADFLGYLGASEDAAKVYFASGEQIPGSGTNSLGAAPVAGEPNVYLYEAGEPASFHFVATLSKGDLNAAVFFPASESPIRHTAQASADGNSLAFMSVGQPTGYDNTDQASGKADAEVYLYRAQTGTLACVSCNPTGARPAGRDISISLHLGESFWAAGQIPTAENQMHFPRVISANGRRLFFESYDPLSLRDSNGREDVYEWEAAGEGNCAEGVPGYEARTSGCINLISSGESPEDSELIDTGSDGRDVFFKTTQSLAPQDPGLVDLYDARAGGGFPPAADPSASCEGEACQGPHEGPNDPTPASSSFSGSGNVDEGPKGPPRCKKPKVRRHGHCVKKRPPKSHRRAGGREGKRR